MLVSPSHEETLACDGETDEIIAIDYSGEDGDSALDKCANDLVDPFSSQQEEIVCVLMDVLLPTVITAITPLIRNIVRIARENDIKPNSQSETNAAECFDDGKSENSQSSWPW